MNPYMTLKDNLEMVQIDRQRFTLISHLCVRAYGHACVDACGQSWLDYSHLLF